jgi:hypothetical protein
MEVTREFVSMYFFKIFYFTFRERKKMKFKKSAAGARITVCYLVELSPYL